ncbi:MAG: HIT domain-containing protein [Candidatus Omnitrophota bacterium]
MKTNRLWAPWRINYIRNPKGKGCIFCKAAKSKTEDLVIFKTEYSICMLNLYPYNNGHILISPLRHLGRLSQLKDIETLDLFRVLGRTQSMLDKVLKPDGYNIGLNLSRSAGAGITGHIHIHIVPRWQGDTNFMPVINNTKVISQSLNELHKQLKNVGPKTN